MPSDGRLLFYCPVWISRGAASSTTYNGAALAGDAVEAGDDDNEEMRAGRSAADAGVFLLVSALILICFFFGSFPSRPKRA